MFPAQAKIKAEVLHLHVNYDRPYNIKKLKAQAEAATNQFVIGLTPALMTLSEELLNAKTHSTELREAGTMALGEGVPAVAHDLLDALPPDRWEREKNRYIYEAWLRNALP